jgi:outer membrane protein assembly factor BamE (lipoprotein component of BamABCDE complex)
MLQRATPLLEKEGSMERFRSFAPAVALGAALSACAIIPPDATSIPPGASRDQVQASLGKPVTTRTLPDGRTAWYYPTGPSGFTTWRVVFGPGGSAAEYLQVLTRGNFEWMREGATREEVLDRVGPPMQSMRFGATGTEAWTYRWRDTTLEMIAEPVFDSATGRVKYVGIFRDPAFSSTMGGGGNR